MKITVERTSMLTRWPCRFCGGWTNKDQVVPFVYGDGDDSGALGAVCDDCVKETPEGLRGKLEAHAQRAIAEAHDLRALATRVPSMPSYDELTRARHEASVDTVMQWKGVDRPEAEELLAREDAQNVPF